MFGFDGHTINNVTSTIFHSEQLYWIILLQSNITFLIHSVNILSPHHLSEGYRSSILSSDDFAPEIDIPIDDLSQLCIEDINQEHNLKTFYCVNSKPSFWHKLVIFDTNYQPTNVSRDLSISRHN